MNIIKIYIRLIMKRLFKLGLGTLIIALSVLAVGCKGKTQKKNSETHENMAKTVYTCPMHPEIMQNEPGSCPNCGMDLVEKTSEIDHSNMHMNDTIYTCSMHPEVEKHEAGDCPKCGMKLIVKKKEMDHSQEEHMK